MRADGVAARGVNEVDGASEVDVEGMALGVVVVLAEVSKAC